MDRRIKSLIFRTVIDDLNIILWIEFFLGVDIILKFHKQV